MKKYMLQFVTGVILVVGIICLRMPQMSKGIDGTVMAISDGFTVIGLLYIGIGVLLYASGNGFFDFLGYAFQRGAGVFIPKMNQGIENYYEYKMLKQEKRTQKFQKSFLITGGLFILLSVVFTIVWYQMI